MTQSSNPQSKPSANHHHDIPPKTETGSPPESGRGPNGRFCKGNPGGPGNPFARQVAAMRQEFLKAVTSEDMAGIVRAMIDKAKEGDVAAAKVVLQYTLGKPAESVDPDRLDEMEWQQWQREKVTAESASVYKSTAASTACTLARILVPVAQKQQLETIEQNSQARSEERRREEERRQHTAQRRAERKARRAETQAAGAAAAGPAPGKEEARVAPVPAQVEATTEAQAPPNVVPVEAQDADNGGQTAAVNASAEAAEWALRLLESTVTKRGETARRAANDFAD